MYDDFFQCSCFLFFCFFTYASTHPGTLWHCHGCHHMAQAQESRLDPSDCQNMGAPELVQLWASRLHPERASSPTGQYLQTEVEEECSNRSNMKKHQTVHISQCI